MASNPFMLDCAIDSRSMGAGSVFAETEPIDEDLLVLARLRSGDRRAFDAFLASRYEGVFRTAWRWCGNRSDAEDVVQEVCMKMAAGLAAFDGRSSLDTWIYRITLNTVHDLRRSRSRRQRRHDGYALETGVSQAPDQESSALARELWGYVDRLPERQRDIVLLVHGEDMTHSEAGAVLGIEEKTVSWYLHEARKGLKEMMR